MFGKKLIPIILSISALGCSFPLSTNEATARIKEFILTQDNPCDFEINGKGFGEGDGSAGYFLIEWRVRDAASDFVKSEIQFLKDIDGPEWRISDSAKMQLIRTANKLCVRNIDE